MTLPGSSVEIVDAAPPTTAITDTGTAFVAGLSLQGVTSGQVAASDAVHSLGEWVAQYGPRQSFNGPDYDSIESFFSEGGSSLYFSRIVGPAAVRATANVPASSSKFTAKAKGPGSYGNALSVAVSGGVITVALSGTTVEVSPALADTAAAQAWATGTSDYIDITPLASGALSDSTAVTLATGADDRSNITDTERQAALDRFSKELGPGSVLLPGDTRTQAHQMLATHARDHNRFAYGDAPDSATVATVAAVGTTARGLGTDLARHIQILEPWLTARGTVPGQTRTIPPSGVQAGIAARNDAAGNPNRAAAGRNGASRFALDVKYGRSDTDRETLANAGITVIRNMRGVIETYDDITTVDPATDPEWLGAAGNRMVMRIVADAYEIADAHMFGSISGPADLSAFNGDLKAMLAGWLNRGALYSATGDPSDAFRVETGPNVNTPDTLAARQLRAALALKLSPNARQVVVQITNTPLQSAL